LESQSRKAAKTQRVKNEGMARICCTMQFRFLLLSFFSLWFFFAAWRLGGFAMKDNRLSPAAVRSSRRSRDPIVPLRTDHAAKGKKSSNSLDKTLQNRVKPRRKGPLCPHIRVTIGHLRAKPGWRSWGRRPRLPVKV